MAVNFIAPAINVGTPDLSIIVPSYNCAQWLERAVLSTTHLGKISTEIIIVDDGSTDGTAALAKELAERVDGLVYLHKTNGGLSSARNHGIEHARGTYILLLDADDELIPCDIQELLSRGHDMVRIGVEEVNYDGTVKVHIDRSEPCTGKAHLSERFAQRDLYPPSWSYLYRREWLGQYGLAFVPGLIHEDSLFIIQALLAAQSFSASDRLVYRYLRRPDSITTSRDDAKRDGRVASLQYIFKQLLVLANGRDDIDMRYWIEMIVDYAYWVASRSTWRRTKFRVVLMQLAYMLKYSSVGGRRFRWHDRKRIKKFVAGWLTNHQAPGESW